MLFKAVSLHDMTVKRAVPTVTLPRGVPKPRKRGLSKREMEIVGLVQQAKTNKEIAYQLRLSEGTVKVYMTKIFDKTGAVNRTDLAVASLRDSVLPPEDFYYGGA